MPEAAQKTLADHRCTENTVGSVSRAMPTLLDALDGTCPETSGRQRRHARWLPRATAADDDR